MTILLHPRPTDPSFSSLIHSGGPAPIRPYPTKSEQVRLSRIHAVRREDFNAKSQSRQDAKRIGICKTGSPNGECPSMSENCFLSFASLRLCVLALNPNSMELA
jgi:hypothetical protein